MPSTLALPLLPALLLAIPIPFSLPPTKGGLQTWAGGLDLSLPPPPSQPPHSQHPRAHLQAQLCLKAWAGLQREVDLWGEVRLRAQEGWGTQVGLQA